MLIFKAFDDYLHFSKELAVHFKVLWIRNGFKSIQYFLIYSTIPNPPPNVVQHTPLYPLQHYNSFIFQFGINELVFVDMDFHCRKWHFAKPTCPPRTKGISSQPPRMVLTISLSSSPLEISFHYTKPLPKVILSSQGGPLKIIL